MFSNSRIMRIEWQHCDPAGIVFYPRYFTMVDTRAKFHIPGVFGDDVEIKTTITEVKRSSFSIEHQILKGGALAVEGWETRVWVGKDPADPAKIKSKPIPPDVVAKLTA